jgi:hypothetical protein
LLNQAAVKRGRIRRGHVDNRNWRERHSFQWTSS